MAVAASQSFMLGVYLKKIVDLVSFCESYNFNEVDLIDVICANRGWKLMEAGEEVTVHINDKEYIIHRSK